MAFALIANGAAAGATSPTLDTTGADLIVVSVTCWTDDPTISDSKGNSWTRLTVQTDTVPKEALFYCLSPTVGSGHTFSVTAGSLPSIAVQAWSGADTGGSYQQESGANGGSSTTVQPDSLTPAQAGSLIVTGINAWLSATPLTFTIDSSFSISDQLTGSGSAFSTGMAYLVQGAAAAVNPTWTIAGGPPTRSAVRMAVFKPAGAASSRRGASSSRIPAFNRMVRCG